jgi:hypothetical protein
VTSHRWDLSRAAPVGGTALLPAELWAALDAEARRTGVSTAELVRLGAELQLAFLAAVRAAEAGNDLSGLLKDMLRRVER